MSIVPDVPHIAVEGLRNLEQGLAQDYHERTQHLLAKADEAQANGDQWHYWYYRGQAVNEQLIADRHAYCAERVDALLRGQDPYAVKTYRPEPTGEGAGSGVEAYRG